MGLETNFTITGLDFQIRTPDGFLFENGGLAIVQWEAGYDPKYRPMSEWTGNPIQVSWTAWYQRDYQGVGQGVFGSNGTFTSTNSPLYLFIDFGNASNAIPSVYGQAWMGQITDSLVLDGTPQVIDLNTANIRSVVGSNVGNILTSQDFNTWQPHAVPEPSYAGGAVLLFAVALAYRFKKRKVEAQ